MNKKEGFRHETVSGLPDATDIYLLIAFDFALTPLSRMTIKISLM